MSSGSDRDRLSRTVALFSAPALSPALPWRSLLAVPPAPVTASTSPATPKLRSASSSSRRFLDSAAAPAAKADRVTNCTFLGSAIWMSWLPRSGQRKELLRETTPKSCVEEAFAELRRLLSAYAGVMASAATHELNSRGCDGRGKVVFSAATCILNLLWDRDIHRSHLGFRE